MVPVTAQMVGYYSEQLTGTSFHTIIRILGYILVDARACTYVETVSDAFMESISDILKACVDVDIKACDV